MKAPQKAIKSRMSAGSEEMSLSDERIISLSSLIDASLIEGVVVPVTGMVAPAVVPCVCMSIMRLQRLKEILDLLCNRILFR
jgi:hypothetical protein